MKILFSWIHQEFCNSARPGFDLKYLLVERLLLFFQGGYTEELHGFPYVVLYVHLVATLHKLPTPRGVIRASCEEEGAWTQGCSSDKITKKKIVSFQTPLCPTVPKETNPKQLWFSCSALKTWRQECPGELKGIRPDFDTKWTSKIHPEDHSGTHLLLILPPSIFNSLREILFGWKSPVSCWSSGGALLGPSCWRAVWRTMPRLLIILYYSNYLPSSFALRNSFSSPSLSPSPLFHPQLLLLSQFVPKLPYSSTQASRTLPSTIQVQKIPISN